MDTLLHHVPVAITVSAISQHTFLERRFQFWMCSMHSSAVWSSWQQALLANVILQQAFALTMLIAGKILHLGDGMG
jgi:hypothetical protein